ncbi:MAG: porin family protein [Calothrix sp. SM1_5_4]|nr:porin family protein [Calothrix sp. SM1_5_4]
MLKQIVLITVSSLFPASVALASVKWDVGLGLESRVQSDVNPDFADFKTAPQLFTQVRMHPWAVLVEFGHEEGRTDSGGFSVDTQTVSLGAWGRYAFIEPERWSPFVSAGLGGNFDRVVSRYGKAEDERRGTRLFAGTGGGVGVALWKVLLLEGEARAVLVQDRVMPLLTFSFRAGVRF